LLLANVQGSVSWHTVPSLHPSELVAAAGAPLRSCRFRLGLSFGGFWGWRAYPVASELSQAATEVGHDGYYLALLRQSA